MESKKNYQMSYAILLLVQAILIIIGFGNAIWQTMETYGGLSEAEPVQYSVPIILNLFLYIALIVYTAYGYKKQTVYYNTCVVAYGLCVYTSFIRIYDQIKGAEFENKGEVVTSMALLGAILLCLFLFGNTYKKKKKVALIIGGVMFLIEVAAAIVKIVTVRDFFGNELSTLLQYLPFSRVIASGALWVSYAARTFWSLNGKQD